MLSVTHYYTDGDEFPGVIFAHEPVMWLEADFCDRRDFSRSLEILCD